MGLNYSVSKILNLSNKYTAISFGVLQKQKNATPLNFLYGELGRFPLSILAQTRMINFWSKLITGKQTKISSTVYRYMIDEQFDCKWLAKIKSILTNIGRPDIWNNQLNINLNNIHVYVKQILIDQFKQTWHAELTQSNKGTTYLSLKHTHGLEKYLTYLNKADSTRIFKFRTANHSLPVETGRYIGINYQERVCPLCQNGSVGDEKHYLLYCEFFNAERIRYKITQLYDNHNAPVMFLLSEASPEILKTVSISISHILKKFSK